MPSLLRFFSKSALLVALPISIAGCGAALKSIDYSVYENGKPVPVQKDFYDGFGIDGNAADSFAAVQKGDLPKAIQLIKQGIAAYPKDPFDRYDLGILYEATGDWVNAEIEMKQAVELENASATAEKRKPNVLFAQELAFAERHKPKR